MAIITSSFPPVRYTYTGASAGGLTYSSIHPDLISVADSSSNLVLFTVNGNAARRTNIYKYGTQSLYLDGANSYLSTAYNSLFGFGSSDFTIEAWVYLLALPTSDNWPGSWSQTGVLFGVGTPSVGDGFDCIIGSTQMFIQSNDVKYGTATHGLAINQWYHLAYVRSGNTISFYVGGVLKGSVAFSGSTGTGSTVYIGTETAQGAYINGYIDELRVTKGVARYTSAFSPPDAGFPVNSTNDPLFANVSLLLKMDGDINPVSYKTYLNSNFSKIVDSLNLRSVIGSSSSKLGGVFNNTSFISSEIKKFGSYSAYFSGSSLSYLLIENLPALANNNFTIEFWAYMNNIGGTQVVFDTRPSGGAYHTIYFSGTSLRYHANSADRISSATVAQNNTWYHIAIVRNGTNTTMYLNGTSQGSFTDTTNYLASASNYIGSSFDNYPANCYIDEFRITASVARYTANFTPPTQAFADTVADDPSFNNVTLLLHMEPIVSTERAIDFTNRIRGITPSHRRTGRSIQSFS